MGNSTAEYEAHEWEYTKALQFNLLIEHGLKPYHLLLDVGCWVLRGGVAFIEYLDSFHYYGVDKNEESIISGERKLTKYGLMEKHPFLLTAGDFQFGVFGTEFDYVLAQSLFSHLNLEDISKCIINIDRVLKEDGKFFATFFECMKESANECITQVDYSAYGSRITIKTYPNRDPYHYTFKSIEQLCENTSLKVKYIGEWYHLHNQKLLLFEKK